MRWGPFLPHDCYGTSYSYRTEKKSLLSLHQHRICLTREKSLREWKVAAHHQVLLCDAALCECVTRLSGLHQGAVASPFTLPQQDNRTSASHGLCCWLFFFFFSLKVCSKNISSFARKHGKESLEKLENRKRFQLYFFLPVSIFRHILWKYNSRKKKVFSSK